MQRQCIPLWHRSANNGRARKVESFRRFGGDSFGLGLRGKSSQGQTNRRQPRKSNEVKPRFHDDLLWHVWGNDREADQRWVVVVRTVRFAPMANADHQTASS